MKRLYIFGLFLFLGNVYAGGQVDAVVGWAHRVDLTIAVDGIVNKVNVVTGQHVKKGQLLVSLDSRIFRANLQKAKARVNSVKAAYEEVNRELQRATELYDRTVLSDHDLQVAKNNEVQAKARLQEVKAELVKARIDLELSSLSAPFAGIILKRRVEVGQAIINKFAQAPLITMASNNEYLARAAIKPQQSEQVSLGQKVKVIVKGKTYNAKIIALEYADDKTTTTPQLVVGFKSRHKNLHAGLKATVVF